MTPKERLSLFWIFALLKLPLCGRACPVVCSRPPHLPQWVLAGSAGLDGIPIAMIVACRLLRLEPNRPGEYHRG